MVVKIVMDTNFLVYLFENRINLDFIDDFFSEDKVELYVISLVKGEIKKIGKKYWLLLNVLLQRRKIKVIRVGKEKPDDILVELAKKGFIIATNDAELRKRIKSFGGKTFYIKKKKYFGLE